MKIICISGKAQHGKDTVAKILNQIMDDCGLSSKIVHFADLLKYICTQFFGWNGEKDDYGRWLLQTIGTDNIRKKDPDFWVGFIVQMARFFNEEWDYWIVADCRFPNEIENFIKAGFEVTHIRVERDTFDSTLSEEQKNHISETALDKTKPTAVIKNDGDLEQLQTKVFDIFKQINPQGGILWT